MDDGSLTHAVHAKRCEINNSNNNALYFYTHIQITPLFKGVYND